MGGMPMNFRFILWPHWCAKYAGKLSVMVDRRDEVKEMVLQSIEKDIPRTMPNTLNDMQRADLRSLLVSYAVRNPVIGYCQGMSFLLYVFLVLGFESDHAFACLCFLLEEVCPSYHDISLEGYLQDIMVLKVLVQQHLPQIHILLDTYDIPLNILAMDHFLCFSACRWPIGAVVRLYDIILLEGTPAVFASFLGLLELFLPEAVTSVGNCDAELNPADIMAQFAQNVFTGVKTDM